MGIKNIAHDLMELFFPRKCPLCGGRLHHDEWLCIDCLSQLPYTHYHRIPGNRLEQRFYGTIPIQRATGYFFYSSASKLHTILHHIKYYGHQELAIYMGRLMAIHMQNGFDFFQGIDCIVPVPLSKKRQHQRGYNQSTLLAQGISEITHIPIINNVLIRKMDNPTQTHLSQAERWENVKGIFEATPQACNLLKGKHMLLLDDVTTTGATLTSCALTLYATCPSCRISIATLALVDA